MSKPFIAVLLHFYYLNFLNSTESRLSNQKSGMVPEVTLIQIIIMDNVTKFQVYIFKNDKARGGGEETSPPPTWNKFAQRQHEIRLTSDCSITLQSLKVTYRLSYLIEMLTYILINNCCLCLWPRFHNMLWLFRYINPAEIDEPTNSNYRFTYYRWAKS